MTTTGTLRRDGDATVTVMDNDGRCDGYATAMTVMERGGNGGGDATARRQRYGATAMQRQL